MALGRAADEGKMPSFSEAGARMGYALGLLCRAQMLADILFLDTVEPVLFAEENINLLPTTGDGATDKNDDRCCNIMSIGGGPGYDFVAAALVASFENECAVFAKNDMDKSTRSTKSSFSTPQAPLTIQTTVYHYKPGWYNIVEAISEATCAVLPNGRHQYSCTFGGRCDITVPCSSNINTNILQTANTTNVFICQYWEAENAANLRLSHFAFLQELLDLAPEGAIFLFTETTHRVWPELVESLLLSRPPDKETANTARVVVAFPFPKQGQNGVCMVLQKRNGAHVISEEHLEMCKKVFAQHQQMNDKDNKMALYDNKRGQLVFIVSVCRKLRVSHKNTFLFE